MTYEREGIAFLPLRANDNFARRLSNKFGISDPDDLVKNISFSNGEYCPTITEVLKTLDGTKRLSGRIACIVYSYTKSDLHTMAAFGRLPYLTDAAYRAGAKEVYLIMSEHMFDRQDLDPNLRYDKDYENFSDGKKRKIDKMQGQPFSLEVAIKSFYNYGIKKVLTLDRHSEATEELYKKIYGPNQVFFNLDQIPIAVDYLLNSGIDIGEDGENLVIVVADTGAKERADSFCERSGLLKAARVDCNKYRSEPNNPKKIIAEIIKRSENFNGMEGKILFSLDDKGDTFGTLEKTLVLGLEMDGRPKQIHVMLSHMLFSSREAYEIIADNRMNVHGSNSHPNMVFKKDEPGVDQISVIDFTPYFAWALVNHVVHGKPLINPDKKYLETHREEFYKVIKKGKYVDF